MKRVGTILFALMLACAAGVWAGTPSDLRYFIPEDSQVVLEFRDLSMIHDVFKVTGLQEQILQAAGPALSGMLKDPSFTLGAEDMDDLARSSIVLAMRIYDPVTRAVSPGGVVAFRLGSAKVRNKVLEMLRPMAEKGRKVGSFTVMTETTDVTGRPRELKTIAFDDELIALGYQCDVGEFAAALVAGARQFRWPSAAVKSIPMESGDLRFRVLVRCGEFGDWPTAILDQVLRQFEKPAKAAEEADKPAGTAEGENREAGAAEKAAQAALMAIFPPEKIRTFVTGLGLDKLRDVSVSLEEKGETCRVAFSLGLAEGSGMLNRFAKTFEGAKLTALDLFPADTRFGMDAVMDLGAVYTMLKEDAVKAFGDALATGIGIGEAGLTAQTGLSLGGEIFPALGREMGFLQVGSLKTDHPVLRLLPFNTVFMVPRSTEAVDKILQTLFQRFGIEVTSEAVKGGKWYRLIGKGDKVVTVHVLLLNGVVFVSMLPDAVAAIRDDFAAGRNVLAKDSFRSYAEKARKDGAVALSFSAATDEKEMLLAAPEFAPFIRKVIDAGLFKPGEAFSASYSGPDGFVSVSEMPSSTLRGVMALTVFVADELMRKEAAKHQEPGYRATEPPGDDGGKPAPAPAGEKPSDR
ncbi:MAG: hypothetical protein KA419_04845 [Acidobacteria bacterium]|nr:hypothetical protein [Acidobacteriota bacterium]